MEIDIRVQYRYANQVGPRLRSSLSNSNSDSVAVSESHSSSFRGVGQPKTSIDAHFQARRSFRCIQSSRRYVCWRYQSADTRLID